MDTGRVAGLPTGVESSYRRGAELLDAERIAGNTERLMALPSPSGQEAAVAEDFASLLSDVGMSVELDREFPESPSVIARFDSSADGRVLQLAGHLDTVSAAHAPTRRKGDLLFGRGACDMKGGLAAIAEVARAVVSAGQDLPVRLLVTAYGQHEEPSPGRGLHQPLRSLLKRGIHGDSCIIPEGPHRVVPVSGKGSAIFEARFFRDGEVSHEILGTHPSEQNPLMACHSFVRKLEDASLTWLLDDPFVGGETFFIGQLGGGDLYNRVPLVGHVAGTRRYPKGRLFEDVVSELEALCAAAAAEIGVSGSIDVSRSGQPFQLDVDEPIVRALRAGHRMADGQDLPMGGIRYSADASHFIEVAHVPTVYHGTDQTSAHADEELVSVRDLSRCARVLLGAVLTYSAMNVTGANDL